MSKFEEAVRLIEQNRDTPCKCSKTCYRCRYSRCIDSDEECEICPNFDHRRRRCKCNDIEYGKPCRYFEEA